MKKLQFSYNMAFTFSREVINHAYTLKCLPPSDLRQNIVRVSLDVLPRSELSFGCDSFGNRYFYGIESAPHRLFTAVVSGEALTGLDECESLAGENEAVLYRYQSRFTKPGSELKKYAEQFHFAKGAGNLERALQIMERLHADFEYKSHSTSIATTAEEALAQRRGVCQDFSHIMLSLCRGFAIPTRYVVGMLIGTGLSHAWVEVLEDGRWLGLDPTHNCRVLEGHIKISHGRDYKDCVVNQGIFNGYATELQGISVAVKELPLPAKLPRDERKHGNPQQQQQQRYIRQQMQQQQ